MINMIKLIKGGEVYAPDYLGKKDLLIADGKIAAIEDSIELNNELSANFVDIIDAQGKIVAPGLVDSLVHIIGGGGEGGFSTRTPEMQLSDAIKGGTTTVVGALGTDASTRTLSNLYAKAKSLTEEGITAFMHTGAYQVPSPTLTGSIRDDLIFIDLCIGVGEVAIADHRSSQPSQDELARIAGEARVGGMLAGKGGIVSIHTGDGDRMLSQLETICDNTEIPITQFYPTHINRNSKLFEYGIQYAKHGGYVDFTTSTTPELLAAGDIKCSIALKDMLDAGVPVEHITFSSDGNAYIPDFDEDGNLRGLKVGRVSSMFDELRDSVLKSKIDISTALKVATSNPARILGLKSKGLLQNDKDADILLIDPETWTLTEVIARGQVMMQLSKIIVKGVFE